MTNRKNKFVLQYKTNKCYLDNIYYTERDMFAGAVQIDDQGYELIDALKETWENNCLIKLERYQMGKPVTIWERG